MGKFYRFPHWHFCFFICGIAALSMETPEKFSWKHSVTLTPNLVLHWNNDNPDWLVAQIATNVSGYVGIGISPSGQMDGSDIVLAWIGKDGQVYLRDYFAKGNGVPMLDTTQNVQLVEGKKDESGTSFTFKRKWNTCDIENDMEIEDGSLQIIWAYSDTAPSDGDTNQLKYHKGQRGVKKVALKTPADAPPDMPADGAVKKWNLQVKDLTVNGDTTLYHCKLFRFPKIHSPRSIIGYLPIIKPEHKLLLHHVTLLRCHVPPNVDKTAKEMFQKYVDHPGGKCYTDQVPSDWVRYCFQFEMALTLGSDGEIMPPHIGSLVQSDETYFILEVHIENPEGLVFTDSPGMRLLYTDQLRKYESTTLFLGQRVTPFMVIPPGVHNFPITGLCSKECTRNGFPPEGVKAFSVILHAHIFAKSIILKHIRNGTELRPLGRERHFDFSNQQYRKLPREVELLPGDEFIVECEYDNPKNYTVVGGLSSHREMCEALLLYYPKSDMIDCRSQYEYANFFETIGLTNAEGRILDKINLPYHPDSITDGKNKTIPDDSMEMFSIIGSEPVESTLFDHLYSLLPDGRNVSVSSYMTTIDWKKMAPNISSKWAAGPHYMHCGKRGGVRIDPEGHIKYVPQYQPYNPFLTCPVEGSRSCCAGIFSTISTPMLFLLAVLNLQI